jgi:twitching motility protein PilI
LSPTAALNRFSDLPHAVVSGEKQDSATVGLCYGFRLANIGLLIEPHTHSEVMEALPIFPLPNTPPWSLGLSNLRGNIVPVYDLEIALNLNQVGEKKRYLLVLGKADQAVGQLIRDLPQPHIWNQNQIMENQPPLPEHLKGFVSNAYIIDHQVWMNFDHQGFFQSLLRQHHT